MALNFDRAANLALITFDNEQKRDMAKAIAYETASLFFGDGDEEKKTLGIGYQRHHSAASDLWQSDRESWESYLARTKNDGYEVW